MASRATHQWRGLPQRPGQRDRHRPGHQSLQNLVQEDLVPQCAVRNGEVAIKCAHGNAITYPLAEITISVGAHEELTVQAAVSKKLLAAVLLGHDVLELMTLLRTKTGTQKPTMGDLVLVLVTTTRVQARTQQQESHTEEHLRVSGGTPSKPVFSEETTSDSEGMGEFDFHSSLFSGGWEKPRLSRFEKRRARREYVPDPPSTSQDPHLLVNSAEELQVMKAVDSTLVAIQKTARGEPGTAGRGFFRKNGLLFR